MNFQKWIKGYVNVLCCQLYYLQSVVYILVLVEEIYYRVQVGMQNCWDGLKMDLGRIVRNDFQSCVVDLSFQRKCCFFYYENFFLQGGCYFIFQFWELLFLLWLGSWKNQEVFKGEVVIFLIVFVSRSMGFFLNLSDQQNLIFIWKFSFKGVQEVWFIILLFLQCMKVFEKEVGMDFECRLQQLCLVLLKYFLKFIIYEIV